MAEHFDIPWKHALDRLLKPFLALFFIKVHDAIDWQENVENLETELQSLGGDAEVGTRRADKLFRVHLKSGERKMLLLHVEVQTTVDHSLPERIMVYWYRIYDHYGERPISLVLLGDDKPKWRPSLFKEELLGFRVEIEYPIAKLLDFDESKLQASDNPIAIVGVAYLWTKATRNDPAERLRHKLELVGRLLEKGYEESLADDIFRLLDWMMVLPDAAERQFREQVRTLKEKDNMRYVTSIERLAREEGLEEGLEKGIEQGLEKGIEQGLEKGIEQGLEKGIEAGLRKGQAALILRLLELRFGAVTHEQARMLMNADLPQLSRWGERVVTAASLDEVFAAS